MTGRGVVNASLAASLLLTALNAGARERELRCEGGLK